MSPKSISAYFAKHRAVPADEKPPPPNLSAVLIVLTLLILPYAVRGYSLASIAHGAVSPGQQLVQHVLANYDTSRITPCWDTQTDSYFEAFTPGAAPSATSPSRACTPPTAMARPCWCPATASGSPSSTGRSGCPRSLASRAQAPSGPRPRPSVSFRHPARSNRRLVLTAFSK